MHQALYPGTQLDKRTKRLQPRYLALQLGPLLELAAHRAGGLVLLGFEQGPTRQDDDATLMAELDNLKGQGLPAVLFGVFHVLGIDVRNRAKTAHIALNGHAQSPLIDRVNAAFDGQPGLVRLIEYVGLGILATQPVTELDLIPDGHDKRRDRVADLVAHFPIRAFELAGANYGLVPAAVFDKAVLVLDLDDYAADLVAD